MIEVRSFSGLAFRSAALTVVLLVIGALPIIPGSTTAAATSDLKRIVGFAAGSGVDSLARGGLERIRLVGARTVRVETGPGGGGRMPAEAVVRAEPDGSTI